jgi:hypothetical protein
MANYKECESPYCYIAKIEEQIGGMYLIFDWKGLIGDIDCFMTIFL